MARFTVPVPPTLMPRRSAMRVVTRGIYATAGRAGDAPGGDGAQRHRGPGLVGGGQGPPVGANGPRPVLEAQHLGDEAAFEAPRVFATGRFEDTHIREGGLIQIRCRGLGNGRLAAWAWLKAAWPRQKAAWPRQKAA